MTSWADLCAHLLEHGVTLVQGKGKVRATLGANTESIHLHEGRKTKISDSTVAAICANLGIPNM